MSKQINRGKISMPWYKQTVNLCTSVDNLSCTWTFHSISLNGWARCNEEKMPRRTSKPSRNTKKTHATTWHIAVCSKQKKKIHRLVILIEPMNMCLSARMINAEVDRVTLAIWWIKVQDYTRINLLYLANYMLLINVW